MYLNTPGMEGEHHLRVPFIYSEFESFDSKSPEKSGAHFFGGLIYKKRLSHGITSQLFRKYS